MLARITTPAMPWSTYMPSHVLSMGSPSNDSFDNPDPSSSSTRGRGASKICVHTLVRPVS